MAEISSLLTELDAVEVEGESSKKIRCFELASSDGNVKVRVCGLGAAITHYFVKNPCSDEYDDIVLGYDDVASLHASQNPAYFGAVVGRVANRIKEGKFDLNGRTYNLEVNDPPNSLHGGSKGFSHRIWEVERAAVIDNCTHSIPFVRFVLESPDGDSGYPVAVKVAATYSLRPSVVPDAHVLSLHLHAQILGETELSTPINLAQHSYFNLCPTSEHLHGVLDHTLHLESRAFTPLDSKSIPTRIVRTVQDDPVMDFSRKSRTLRDAIQQLGSEKMNFTLRHIQKDLERRMPVIPYGIDHNFVVTDQPFVAVPKVAALSHESTALYVHSTAPGVQVYTGNFLGVVEGETPDSRLKSEYRRWSGVCLETQHFPDSIMELGSEVASPAFAKGKCPLLSSDQPHYHQVVEYTVCRSDEAGNKPVGSDTNETSYDSIDSMWETWDLAGWYRKSREFYDENCPPTVDGVLGRLGWLNDDDIDGSRNFVHQLGIVGALQGGVACECGAGIGRVTKGLLLDLCSRCDVVESSSRLLNAAPDYIGRNSHRCRFFCTELQNWSPPCERYALVWIQWTAIYLTDADVVKVLKRCRKSLVPGGCIILKENTCDGNLFIVDVDDASVTRSLPYWRNLIFLAGLRIIDESWQENFPDDIYPVRMIALKPIDWS